MKLALRPANEDERPYCEALTRSNLSAYLAARAMPWNAGRYGASWNAFENLVIVADGRTVGVLRLRAECGALEIRELQVDPASQRQGIGTWAIGQAKTLAAIRGFEWVRLRVFEENPARALYARLGFGSESIAAGKVQMGFAVLPGAAVDASSAAKTGAQRA